MAGAFRQSNTDHQPPYTPHPESSVIGVGILVRITLDPFVKRGPHKTPALFWDTHGTMLGITVHLPNRKPLRILRYCGLL